VKHAGVSAFLLILASVLPAQASFQELLASGTARQVLEAVQAGADVRQSSRAGVTPLMIAAAGNPDPGVITVLLAAGAAIDEPDWVGATALIYAARFNTHPEMVTMLARSGAEVDLRDGLGETALMYAAQYNPNADVVRALVDSGAAVDGHDASGISALMLAARGEREPEKCHGHDPAALCRAGNDDPEGDPGSPRGGCRRTGGLERRRFGALAGLEECASAGLRRDRFAPPDGPLAGLFGRLRSAVPSSRRCSCQSIWKNAPIPTPC